MPDAIMLTNGDRIFRVTKINGVTYRNAASRPIYQNSRTKELCGPDGNPLESLDVAGFLGDLVITSAEPYVPSLPPPLTILKDPDTPKGPELPSGVLIKEIDPNAPSPEINIENMPDKYIVNENHPDMARRLAQDFVDSRDLKLGKPPEPEILGGVWQCTSCTTIRDMDVDGIGSNWRQVDKHYEHNCPGYGCGYFQAVQIYPEKSAYPGFDPEKHVASVDFGKDGEATVVIAEKQSDGKLKILYDTKIPPTKDYDLDHIFRPHPLDEPTVTKYTNVRHAARQFAKVVILTTPDCADRSVAIRKIREAVMTANAAIALKGRLYK